MICVQWLGPRHFSISKKSIVCSDPTTSGNESYFFSSEEWIIISFGQSSANPHPSFCLPCTLLCVLPSGALCAWDGLGLKRHKEERRNPRAETPRRKVCSADGAYVTFLFGQGPQLLSCRQRQRHWVLDEDMLASIKELPLGKEKNTEKRRSRSASLGHCVTQNRRRCAPGHQDGGGTGRKSPISRYSALPSDRTMSSYKLIWIFIQLLFSTKCYLLLFTSYSRKER